MGLPSSPGRGTRSSPVRSSTSSAGWTACSSRPGTSTGSRPGPMSPPTRSRSGSGPHGNGSSPNRSTGRSSSARRRVGCGTGTSTSAGAGGAEDPRMLRLESLTKRFGETAAVADLSLEVRPGEFLTLLGPSGCGKTTTLRMIAGFETPAAGRILLDGKDITGLSPQRRGFGMVFQSYALFPPLDVFENVAFGLRTQRRSRTEIRRRVEEALALVDLAGYGGRRVQELSGGQQQRVALARALAPEPRVLLLD